MSELKLWEEKDNLQANILGQIFKLELSMHTHKWILFRMGKMMIIFSDSVCICAYDRFGIICRGEKLNNYDHFQWFVSIN